MKIITWNCNMAFRKKASFILDHKPDILIVPECEHPDKLLFSDNIPEPTDILWFGKNRNKGLAVFSFGDYRFKVLENHNQDLKMIIPIAVTGKKFTFTLFAIWANNPADKDGAYIEQVWKAIQYYDGLLLNTNTILIGDFNSNKIWDKKGRISNHENIVNLLEKKGIFSTYHLHHKQIQGLEADPTLFMYRHKNKPYHIDYCFVSEDMLIKLESVVVGDYEFWAKYSDHMPVIVNFHND